MARPRIPVFVEPMIATRAPEIPTGAEWVHERKHDGYRILAYVNHGDVRLLSRNGKDSSKAVAPIADALRALGKRQAIMDGEVAAKRAHGAASAAKLRKIATSPYWGGLSPVWLKSEHAAR